MKISIISLGLFFILALNVESKYLKTLKAVQDSDYEEADNEKKVPQHYPESDYLIIYQEPIYMPLMDRFYYEDQFNQPFNNFWSPFSFNPMFHDPFGFNHLNQMPSLMMSKLMNSLPNFQTSESRRPDIELEVQSCDSIDSELQNSEDNYKTNNFFSYHYESSTCSCNQTNYCKISFSKPDLDFCYLNEISDEIELSNCGLLEYCLNDEKKCDGIYVDHRFNKYFSVYCKGNKVVPNVSAKSAKQFIIQLKNCL
ncbi:hypothetical protein BpHYR1_006088 [Brachionus plicatilis]|uniref:Uncharacterized protein n=1 Tax=Brachionus plicatilis TaxID=10195 RepID=A0A3M7SFR9_BRAPC|nr:hypothetical protein BpHYR1_006088 [Brachionus plicatilis]